MPGTRTTQNVGPVLGTCYPVDVTLVADEVNLWERNAKLIVYKKTLGQGKFEAVISDAEGNEHDVVVGATALNSRRGGASGLRRPRHSRRDASGSA